MVDGDKIRELREAKGLTTVGFAEKVLISQTSVSQIENCVKQPSVAVLKRIADYFNVTVDKLIKKEQSA